MRTHFKKALTALLIVYGFSLLVWLFFLGSLDLDGFVIGLKSLSKVVLPPMFIAEVFRRWIWEWKPVQMWLKVPNLRGVWKGELISSYDRAAPIPLTVTITQTLTSLHVTAKTKTSRSLSSCAHLIPHFELPRYQLIFTYLNTPNGGSGLDMHWGTSVFDIEGLHPKVLEGSYFTNRTPQTQGAIKLKKTARA